MREVDCLKQFSRQSCLIISGVKLPEDKNKETAAETTEKVKELLTDSLHIDPTELDNEIDKVHRSSSIYKVIRPVFIFFTIRFYKH